MEGAGRSSRPELCAKIALWCPSDCTTALHLTCLRPRPGASHYGKLLEEAPCLAANQVNIGVDSLFLTVLC